MIPFSHGSIPEWQRIVAVEVNPLLNSQYTIDSSKLTYTGNAHKLLRINSAADGVELSSDLDSVTFSQAGAQVAGTATTGINLLTGKTLTVNSVQVVKGRITGWATATGTATRTTYATYAGQTVSNPPTQTEVQNIDDHVKILSQRLKALIDDLHGTAGHGLIGT